MSDAARAAAPPARTADAWALAALFALFAFAIVAWRFWAVRHLGLTLFVDEAQYWDWSRRLEWGYYSKPPVIAALIAVSTAVAGDGVLGVKALAMLLHPMAALVLARLAFDMAGRRAAVVAFVLAMTAPVSNGLGMFATTDAPLLMAWALAAWALWQALAQPTPARWAAFGLAFAFGLLSKYTMAAFALTLLAVLWLERRSPEAARHRRGAALAAGIVALLLAPHLAWNHAHGWPTWRHTAEITVRATRAAEDSAWLSWAGFSAAQAMLVGPVTALLIIAALARRPAQAAAPTARARAFAAALTLPLLGLGMVQALLSRAQVNWAAPALLGAVLWLALQPARVPARLLVLAAATNLLLFALVVHLPDAARAIGRPLPYRLDAWSRMRGWDTAFASLRPAAQAVATPAGGAVLVGTGRALLAHASYEWRDLPLRVVAWNPLQRQDNHYELMTRLPAPQELSGRPMLLLADSPGAGGAVEALAPAVALGHVEVQAGPGRVVRLFLWQVGPPRGAP